ncbi:hypothetical protein H5410_040201 [Solanum commersonii]|uniref:Uncharacterized protein n=1 Tax=Solanum commersonii TaxID=4109 RepID=A0A9J5XQA3_SOLCO|nr:hypothetical protein H5410_040201 [Solanum commersonii]
MKYDMLEEMIGKSTNVEGDNIQLDVNCTGMRNSEAFICCRNCSTMKVYNRWSNKSFNMLLELLSRYISIHTCKYDSVLYWGEFKDRQECPQWYFKVEN